MPIIKSKYKAPFIFQQMDIITIYTAKFRKVKGVSYQRERIELPDGDFIDLDWSKTNRKTNKCVIMLHGLEGSSKSQYMFGLAKAFNQKGYDACAVNFRSCSGEPNRNYISYHSGKTDDVIFIINQIIQACKYDNIVLHGVSLGANVALKYIGETIELPKELKAVVAVSAPCDLSGSSANLLKKRNFVYAYNFYNQLLDKVKQKHRQFPNKLSKETISQIKNMKDVDEFYTAPAHGFENAEDYYAKNSSLQFLDRIKVPTLILNAKNDSFLSDKSYPYAIAQNHKYLYLEAPKHGGHVAFWQKGSITYNEQRALEFVEEVMMNQ